MRIQFFAVCTATILLVTVPAWAAKETFPGERRTWHRYVSPNFELYSSNSDRESRAVLYDLELFHATFLDFLKLKVRRPLPVTLFYFSDDDDFRAYFPASIAKDHNFAGFYVERPDRAVILMSPRDESKQAQRLIQHEYVHHLFRILEERPPPWFNEGMAELFSTLQQEGDKMIFGRPAEGRVVQILQDGLMPMEQLFAVGYQSPVFRAGAHTGKFYAQSWLFVHYCYFGAVDLPRDKLALFLNVARSPRLADDPELVRKICRELLGIDYPELQRRLERYTRSGRYQARSLPVPVIAEAKTYTRTEVSGEEAQLRLAEIAARVKQSPQAKLALLHAADRRPQDTRIDETLGMLAFAENDLSGARERWERALQNGSGNPAVFHELARLRTRTLFQQFDPYYRMPADMAAELRSLLRRSIVAAPQQTAAYEMLAWVEATSAECEVTNVNLVQERFPTLKTKDRTLVSLALVRHRRGDDADALALLDDLPKLDPDDWSLRAAEVLRAKIEGRKPTPVRREGGPTPKAPPVRIQIKPEALKAPGT
jgi:tetratricopeptide (TPR) repeat protein